MKWTTLAVLVGSLGLACTRAQPPNSAPDPAATSFPQLHMQVEDTAADEGASWDVVASGDGSFTVAFTSSDGARDTTVRCAGRLPAADVQGWLAELGTIATLAAPMPHPKRNWDGTDPAYFFTVSRVTGPSARTFVDGSSSYDTLETWFRTVLDSGGTC